MTDQFEKYERDGKVAVLYSPGHGAGWSTWNRDCGPAAVFDREIVEAVLSRSKRAVREVVERKYPEAYAGGVDDLKVEWVPKGARFEVNEYDGSESVRVFSPDDGYQA